MQRNVLIRERLQQVIEGLSNRGQPSPWGAVAAPVTDETIREMILHVAVESDQIAIRDTAFAQPILEVRVSHEGSQVFTSSPARKGRQ
jgi:hypothetical protein